MARLMQYSSILKMFIQGTSVISPILPFLAVVLPAFIISEKSTDEIFEKYTSLYVLAFGMVAAKVTNKLVVCILFSYIHSLVNTFCCFVIFQIAHMTKSEMGYLDVGLMGPLLLFLNQYFNSFLPEYCVLWIAMIWCTLDLMRYCSQVCGSFDVQFSIRHIFIECRINLMMTTRISFILSIKENHCLTFST